jgi:hypothetical protein
MSAVQMKRVILEDKIVEFRTKRRENLESANTTEGEFLPDGNQFMFRIVYWRFHTSHACSSCCSGKQRVPKQSSDFTRM